MFYEVYKLTFNGLHLCVCVLGAGEYRQVHLRPECLGQEHPGQSYSINGRSSEKISLIPNPRSHDETPLFFTE